jgi:tetratricopeptide (TPR) repeat protein
MRPYFNQVMAILVIVVALLIQPAQTGAQGSAASQREYNRLVNLSRKLGEKKDFVGAEKAIRSALKISARDEWAWRHLSWCQRNQSKFPEAIASAQAALRLRKTPWGFYDLAEAAYGNLDFDLARETANKALSLGRKTIGNVWEPLRGVLDRVSTKEYVMTDKVDPKKCRRKDGKITLFVAQSVLPYQTAESVALNVTSFTVRPWGDLAMMEVVPKGDEPFEIVSTIRVTPTPMRKALASYSAREMLPDEVRPYLQATPAIDINGKEVLALAKQLRGRDDVETVNNIVAWFGKHFTYDGNAGGSADQIAKACRGHCDAIARLCSALCRVNGIACRPVRMNWGGSPPVPWHSVCEVYVRGQGWVPLDAGTSPFGTWPKTCWPSNALRLHYYPAVDKDAPHWVEHVRLGDAPPSSTAKVIAKTP